MRSVEYGYGLFVAFQTGKQISRIVRFFPYFRQGFALVYRLDSGEEPV